MHKEFKRLLVKATGVSEHVIAINLDIRGFSSFCNNVQDWDVANYVKIVYSKILDDYFQNASYYKATGDGLIIIIRCTASDVKDNVNNVLESSLKLVENFSSLCNDEPIINFSTPTKIGIGIARGSVCCISNLEEEKILDYSGRILNLASRLMDMARPAGIVIDQSLGIDLLKGEYKNLFIKSNVYVRGISENDKIVVYHTKNVIIPEEYKKPKKQPKWESSQSKMLYSEIKKAKAGYITLKLSPESLDDDAVCAEVKIVDPNTESEVIQPYATHKETFDVVHRGTRHIARIDRQKLLNDLADIELADDSEVRFILYYLVET